MRKLTLVCLALLLAAGSAFAARSPQHISDLRVSDARASVDEFLNSTGAAAKQDTIYIIGGPNRTDGKFQHDSNPSLPDAEGWYGVDMTAPPYSRWNISTYHSPTGTPAAWAGQQFASDCSSGDFYGYGNSWKEWLDWTGTVANPGADTTVDVTAVVSYDTEAGYDYLSLQYETGSGWYEQNYWDGRGVAVPVAETIQYTGGDYANGNQVHLRWAAISDGAWSDGDCLYPTTGHSQIDNVSVSFNSVEQTFDDFNSGMGDNWETVVPLGVGDFSKVWPLLEGIDDCINNRTPQFAFIDDGAVVPGVGPSTNTIFTYGPNSYTRNATGGRGTDGVDFLDNNIWSPPIAFPPGTFSGAILQFSEWIHSELQTATADGIMRHGQMRCSTDGGNTWFGWTSAVGSQYGGPAYTRQSRNVTSQVKPGTTHVQLSFGMWEYDGWGTATTGTPAGWIDNVVFKVFNYTGPIITSGGDWDLANDQFAKNLDLGDLPSNALRFDMAQDILNTLSPNILHGDSIVFNVQAVRVGSALVGKPEMHFKIKCNPLFPPEIRDMTVVDGYIEGVVEGDSVFTTAGVLVPNRWAFDLPDGDETGSLLYPGDHMHYYISATDRVGGDPGTDVTVTLPSNLAAYGIFPGEPGYIETRWSYLYTYRGLPSVSDLAGTQPEILFWNDFGVYGGLPEWKSSLSQLGLQEGIDYDIYFCQAPSSQIGNGLGSNASQAALAGYSTILYSAGYLDAGTICGPANPGNSDDKSNDIAMLENWLSNGKNLFVTGDGVIGGTSASVNVNGLAFVNNWLGCDYIELDVAPLLGGVKAPLVVPVAGNVVGFNTPFVAYGSCLSPRNFNAMDRYASSYTSVIGEFIETGAFPDYAAVVSNYRTDVGSKIVTACVDFRQMFTPYGSDKDDPAPISARTQVLSDVLVWFGFTPAIGTTPTPSAGVFSAKNYPNPFNPMTKIEWSIPRAGDLSIKVFNVKGELVRTLHDGFSAERTGVAEWNGTGDNGRDVASGIYFYEVRSGDNVSINKMTLVK